MIGAASTWRTANLFSALVPDPRLHLVEFDNTPQDLLSKGRNTALCIVEGPASDVNLMSIST